MTGRVAITLALAVLLSGCASTRRPEPQLRIQRVEVPIPVPCVREMPQRPASPVEALTPDAALGDMIKALLAERRLRESYVGEIEAILQACAAHE